MLSGQHKQDYILQVMLIKWQIILIKKYQNIQKFHHYSMHYLSFINLKLLFMVCKQFMGKHILVFNINLKNIPLIIIFVNQNIIIIQFSVIFHLQKVDIPLLSQIYKDVITFFQIHQYKLRKDRFQFQIMMKLIKMKKEFKYFYKHNIMNVVNTALYFNYQGINLRFFIQKKQIKLHGKQNRKLI